MDLKDSGLSVEDAGKWFVTTDLFKRGGRVVEGPFSTRAEATDARGDNITHWIDQAPRTMIRFKSSA
jgi:hypothetical protein